MMPWTRTDWMSERVKFIAADLEYEASFADLCQDFGVSRKTGYKWVHRQEAVHARRDPSHSETPASADGTHASTARDGRARRGA